MDWNLDKVVRSLVWIMPKISRYVKTLKVKDGDKDRNNTLAPFCRHDGRILEKYKANWIKIEDLNWFECFTSLSWWIFKNWNRISDDKIYTNFRSLNVQEDDIECE